MRIHFGQIGSPEKRLFEDAVDLVRIGNDPSNHIVLRNAHISSKHLVLSRNGAVWELTNSGAVSVGLGAQKLLPGERTTLYGNAQVTIFPFELTFEAGASSPNGLRLDEKVAELIVQVHGDLLARMKEIPDGDHTELSLQALRSIEEDIDELARLRGLLEPANAGALTHAAGCCVQGVLLSKIIDDSENHNRRTLKPNGMWTKLATASTEMERELATRANALESRVDPLRVKDLGEKIALIERNFWPAWKDELLAKRLDHESSFIQYLGKRHIKKQIKDIVFGYGPLEDLLRLPNITEIMVVSRDKIYVEKKGVLERSGRRFVSDQVTVSIIQRIVDRVGRRIDKSQPLVDARLTDGSRVNAVIDPIAVSGPCLTIRKFPAKKLTIDDLIGYGAITRQASEFLEAAVIMGKNILISGGTGTGKTTMLNCLSDYIPDKERIVTVEDTAELQLKKEHVVTLETKVANVEGKGEYTIRDLVRNALRMRPDRIVVGECRGAEALDMLQAMNTGHDGSMTTIHANSSEDVVQRLEVMVQIAAEMPIESIHRQVASAINLVVQLNRLDDGSRKVTQITELVTYDALLKKIVFKDLFRIDGKRKGASLAPTGSLPTFMGELMDRRLLNLEKFYM